jgi:hypothetical protein
MKTFLILAIAGLFYNNLLTAQNEIVRQTSSHRAFPKNSIYLEFAGYSMGLGSLNYERVFFHQSDFYLTARAGVGIKPGRYQTVSFPLLVNGIYQVSNKFALEFGAGTDLSYTSWDSWTESYSFWFIVPVYGKIEHPSGSFFTPLLVFNTGFRVQKPKGFIFRFNFTPIINFKTLTEEVDYYSTLPRKVGYWFGMSFGKSF